MCSPNLAGLLEPVDGEMLAAIYQSTERNNSADMKCYTSTPSILIHSMGFIYMQGQIYLQVLQNHLIITATIFIPTWCAVSIMFSV
jgi:hypothetical protein